MIAQPGSRLSIVAVLLTLQVLIFIFELLIFLKTVRLSSWYTPLRQLFGPVSIALLRAILAPITFNDASKDITSTANQCNNSIDGDIDDVDVRIAVWAQVSVLLVISLLGSFHASATGAKEVGAELVLTHISLAIALLV
jgi:hypothetical protein